MRLAPRVAAIVPLVVVALAPASRADALPPPPVAAPAPAMPIAEPGDEVLRRLLRSGCRDGVPDVRALAAQGAVPWAATAARLCDEILRAPPTPVPSAPSAPAGRDEHSGGRGTIVFTATLYGIWFGIATDILVKVNDVHSAIVPPLLGMASGLGFSLLLTHDHSIDNGQAWTIGAGLEYGTLNGGFWAGGFDLSAQAVVGTALAVGMIGGAVGIGIANSLDPAQGDVEVVRSGLLWGTLGGMLGLAALSSSGGSETTFFRGSAAAMDLGFLAGLGVAATSDVSRDRMLIIDAATLGGSLGGAGILWLTTGTSNSLNWRAIAGGGLGGMALGMASGILLTRHMDHKDAEPGSNVDALLGRDARGRWHLGTPGPTPVFDGLGRRVIGATFTAVGGSI